jgi:hypothetical protein
MPLFIKPFHVIDLASSIPLALIALFKYFSHNYRHIFRLRNTDLHRQFFIHQLVLPHFLFFHIQIFGIL